MEVVHCSAPITPHPAGTPHLSHARTRAAAAVVTTHQTTPNQQFLFSPIKHTCTHHTYLPKQRMVGSTTSRVLDKLHQATVGVLVLSTVYFGVEAFRATWYIQKHKAEQRVSRKGCWNVYMCVGACACLLCVVNALAALLGAVPQTRKVSENCFRCRTLPTPTPLCRHWQSRHKPMAAAAPAPASNDSTCAWLLQQSVYRYTHSSL